MANTTRSNKTSNRGRTSSTAASTRNNNNGMSDTTKTLLTLAAGAVAGAVTALLLAPQSGTETRRALSKTANRLSDSLNGTIQQGIDKINQLRGGHSADDMESTLISESTGRKQASSAYTNNDGLTSTGKTSTGNTGSSGMGTI